MNSFAKTAYDEKVDSLVATYTQQGFIVVKEPSLDDLPFDLGGYRPDLVATKGDAGLIIEVKAYASRVSVDRFQVLAQEISKHPGWRFLLVTLEDVDTTTAPTSIDELPTWAQISKKLQQAQSLIAEGALEPALLYLWSIFEAALRKRAITQNIPVERLPVSSLLKQMYSQGEVSVNDIDFFREFMGRRNRIAHGANMLLDATMATEIFQSVHRLVIEWERDECSAQAGNLG
jgi:Holliday junction resolvase